MASFKKAEDDVYSYLNKRWRIGWSLVEVSNFYNNLSHRQVIDESADMTTFFGIGIRLPSQMEIEHHNLPKTTVRSLAEALYKARGEHEERLLEPPKAPAVKVTDDFQGAKSNLPKQPTWQPTSSSMGNNHPLIFDDEDDFMDNIAGNKMEAGELIDRSPEALQRLAVRLLGARRKSHPDERLGKAIDYVHECLAKGGYNDK